MSTSEFTKYMIAQGMKQLLKTASFESISVSDLAKQCHVSRNTVYYHFKDKYDIINWIFYSEITPIIGESSEIAKWPDGLLALCQYMQENREFYIKVLHEQGQNSFSECLMDFYVNLICDLFLKAKGDQILSQEQIRVISNFYAFGITGIIMNWAKNGMEKDPRSAVNVMKDLISGDIFDKLLALRKRDD